MQLEQLQLGQANSEGDASAAAERAAAFAATAQEAAVLQLQCEGLTEELEDLKQQLAAAQTGV